MSRQASGLRAWVIQRISAAYMGLFTLLLFAFFAFFPPADHQAWREWIAHPLVAFGLTLFIALLLIHAWVGIRDVLIDYVKPFMVRFLLLTLFGLGFVGCGIWAAKIIFLAATPIG